MKLPSQRRLGKRSGASPDVFDSSASQNYYYRLIESYILCAEMRKSAELVLRFVLDIAFGIIGFIVVGLAALALGKFVKWIDSFQVVPSWIIKTMIGLEYAMFVADGIACAFLVLMSTAKFMGAVWRDRNEAH